LLQHLSQLAHVEAFAGSCNLPLFSFGILQAVAEIYWQTAIHGPTVLQNLWNQAASKQRMPKLAKTRSKLGEEWRHEKHAYLFPLPSTVLVVGMHIGPNVLAEF